MRGRTLVALLRILFIPLQWLKRLRIYSYLLKVNRNNA